MKKVWIVVVVVAAVFVGYSIWAKQAVKQPASTVTTRPVMVKSAAINPMAPGPENKCIVSYSVVAPSSGTPCYDKLFSKPTPSGKYYDLSTAWGCRFKPTTLPADVCPGGSQKFQEHLSRYYCVSDTLNVEEMSIPCVRINNDEFYYSKVALSSTDAKDREVADRWEYAFKCAIHRVGATTPVAFNVCVGSGINQAGAGYHPSSSYQHDVCCYNASRTVDKLMLQPKERSVVPAKVRGRPEKTRVAP